MQHLDPTHVAVTIASAVLAPALAEVVGPYVIIFIASTIGASWALGRQATMSRLKALFFFLRINFTAAIVTSSIASALAKQLGYASGTGEGLWLIAPIALVIGGVGDDWPALIHWVVKRKFFSGKGDQ